MTVSSTTQLFMVRHGESLWNLEGRLTGWTDVALTAHGRAQAEALRPLLAQHAYDYAWSSPLARAAMTGTLAWGDRYAFDERLKEFHFGEHEGAFLKDLGPDYLSLLKRFETYAPPGGESGQAFYDRVDSFFDALPPGKHVVFTHGGVIRRLYERVGIRKFVGNAGLCIVDWTEKRLIVEHENPLLLRK